MELVGDARTDDDVANLAEQIAKQDFVIDANTFVAMMGFKYGNGKPPPSTHTHATTTTATATHTPVCFAARACIEAEYLRAQRGDTLSSCVVHMRVLVLIH